MTTSLPQDTRANIAKIGSMAYIIYCETDHFGKTFLCVCVCVLVLTEANKLDFF